MALPTFTPGTTIKASEMNQALATLFDMAHPVGSYYETSDISFNPNSVWPGTWVEDTAGRVLVASDSGTFATVGDTGGAETHTNELTSDGIARIILKSGGAIEYAEVRADTRGGDYTTNYKVDCTSSSSTTTNNQGWGAELAGKTGSGSSLPPYIVVKRWHRTA